MKHVAARIRIAPWSIACEEEIAYDLYDTPFGRVGIATTACGVCAVGFFASSDAMRRFVRAQYSHVVIRRRATALQRRAARMIADPTSTAAPMIVHVRAPEFYVRVWRVLCAVPCGTTICYGALARRAGAPGAARAVGRAMACNPVVVLIPCHRVVRSDGTIGSYHYGVHRKKRLLAYEEMFCRRVTPG